MWRGTMEKMTVLSPYLQPDETRRQLIEDLERYYQVTHQNIIQKYTEQQKTGTFSGTLYELTGVLEEEKLERVANTPWEPLIKAIYFIKNHTSKVDMTILPQLDPEEKKHYIEIIEKGIIAKNKVEGWLKPLLEKKDVPEAIYDATMVNFEHEFHLLDLGPIENYRESGDVGLFRDILEIKDPDELIYYLKHRKEPIGDVLIVTIQRNTRYDFRSVFMLFMIYNGHIYSIDNSDRRINLDHTAGARAPGKYIRDKYWHVWLPLDLLEEKETNIPMVKDLNIYKKGSWDQIGHERPVYLYWLHMFIVRVAFLIEKKKFKKGITARTLPPLLSGANRRNEFSHVKKRQKGKYLIDAYGKTCTDIVLKKEEVPAVLGSKKYIQEVLHYQRKKRLALQIQQTVYDTYNEKKKEVRDWWGNLLKKYGVEYILLEALQEKKYTWRKYHQFADYYKPNPTYSCLTKDKIVSKPDHWWATIRTTNAFHFGEWVETEQYVSGGYYKQSCCLCDAKMKLKIKLDFIDYRQIMEFFNIQEKELHPIVRRHLHQASQMYIGNSILDDLDPFDGIVDPWFVGDEVDKIEKNPERLFAREDAKRLKVIIPLCKRCYNKYKRKAMKKREVE